MDKPLISVIVPIYKVEAFLSKCVDSLLAQTYPNLEIILVDDGSPDRCGEICDAYQKENPNIRVIHKENGGLSSARNAGIDIAEGEFIAFVDSDDWVDTDSYEKLYSLIEKYRVPMACAGRYDVDGTTGAHTLGLCPPAEEKISGQETARRIFTWDGMDAASWDKLYHRSLFEGIRYPVGIIGEDLPVTYRLALKAGECAMGDFPFYHYLHRANSITQTKFSEKNLISSRESIKIDAYIRENYPDIKEASEYLRIYTMANASQCMDILDKASQAKFEQIRVSYRRQLRRDVKKILTNPYFSFTQRRDFCLIAFNLYRLPRAVYHLIKG